MPLLDKDTLKNFQIAKNIVFFTGAGISAESGIPTFRGKEGIWKKLKPEELASFDAFIRNPELVWEWYNHRKHIVHTAQPNPGHKAIADMQELFNTTVITQNVDNLHRRAGSRNIFELHGNIERSYCIQCREFFNEDFDTGEKIPKCKCGGLIRPDVVWFGEMLPEDQYSGGENAAKMADIFIIAGTSAVVYPAASLVYTAKQYGAYLIEINIEETEISEMVNKSFFEESGKILPQIFDELKKLNIAPDIQSL